VGDLLHIAQRPQFAPPSEVYIYVLR
jgi:hypothetical protein